MAKMITNRDLQDPDLNNTEISILSHSVLNSVVLTLKDVLGPLWPAEDGKFDKSFPNFNARHEAIIEAMRSRPSRELGYDLMMKTYYIMEK